MSISLRPISPADEEFLFAIYASTREDELAKLDWNAAQKQLFLRMQFDAQARFYEANYPGATFQVILYEDQPVGRLYLQDRTDGIRIMDIALLPRFRNHGIGTTLLGEILMNGQNKNLPVTIHVERTNPALHWYQRLGFRLLEDKGVYLLMEWTPNPMEVGVHVE
jgi:ribosomal protein S18 acetylase RimI-like enzyme